jgi:hypothetical protein
VMFGSTSGEPKVFGVASMFDSLEVQVAIVLEQQKNFLTNMSHSLQHPRPRADGGSTVPHFVPTLDQKR